MSGPDGTTVPAGAGAWRCVSLCGTSPSRQVWPAGPAFPRRGRLPGVPGL